MRFPPPPGLTTVRFNATAAGLGGMAQLPASPPCAPKPPLATHTLKSRLELAAIGPPAKRVSAKRHGSTGVYTRSSPVSPSSLAGALPDTRALPMSQLRITTPQPPSGPAITAARKELA